MPQFLDSGSGVGLRMLDISRAWRTMLGGQTDTFDFLQELPRLIQRITIAVTRIENFARNTRWCGRRLQKQSDNIFHIGEVTRLFSVAVNRGGAPLDQAVQKDRKNARVDTGRILSGPEHVEEPQRYSLQFETTGEYARV